MSSLQPFLRARHPLLVAVATTAVVTASSYGLPEAYAATSVGLTFMVATYVVALHRRPTQTVRQYGLSLGGLLEPEPLEPRRMVRELGRALGWAAAAGAVLFPLFWLGYLWWWDPPTPFLPTAPPSVADEVLGQLAAIALPEEAFYRGYLQTALDAAWRPRWRVLGARIGPGLLVASALFAIGHLVTEVHPDRLAVFFPALIFGWLRARTGGIGAPVLFHTACNLFASFLGRGYGLAG